MNKFINKYGYFIALGCVSYVFCVLADCFIDSFLYCIYFIIVGVIVWLLFTIIINQKTIDKSIV